MERWDVLCTTENVEAFLLYRELIKYRSQSQKTEQLLLVWSGAQCVLAFSQTRLGGCCSEHEAGAVNQAESQTLPTIKCYSLTGMFTQELVSTVV